MPAIRLWKPYPSKGIQVVSFVADLPGMFERPPGLEDPLWPPTQMVYLGRYLETLGCKTIAIESHYIDRDYIADVALLYSRSLRAYDNFCQRLHFFREAFDQSRWMQFIVDTTEAGQKSALDFLQDCYLGFSVLRPLPGSPVGRTVLPPPGETTATGQRREFAPIRDYQVHLARFELTVRGLAFQQQDQGQCVCDNCSMEFNSRDCTA